MEDGVAILKVGPALTFALREGLFALECVERELRGRTDFVPSHFRSGAKLRSPSGNHRVWKPDIRVVIRQTHTGVNMNF